MRVVIAEDSILLREGLKRLLSENGPEVVGSCLARRGGPI
jgi:DNA-binding NarL/FixJ family response regulator